MALTRLDNIEQIYPLTPMQQGMLFHTIHNNSGEYFEITSCTIKGDLQVDAFEKAINRLVDRHTALRSSFVWKKVERMQQIVHKNVTIPLHFEDWTTFSEQEQKEKFDTALRNERENGFNLSKPPLLRFAVFKLEKDTHKFYWCFNHILCDGWSTPIVLNEVMTAYNVIVNNSPDDLPPARPFKSYIDWISAQDQGRARAFWSELLGDFSAPATLVKNNHNSEMEHDYLKNSFAFSVYLSSKLADVAKRYHVTINTLVQAAWALLISKYTMSDDIVFGSTVSGRSAQVDGIEGMIGLFINTLPTRIKIRQDQTVVDWLREIHEHAIAAREFEFSPLVEIKSCSQVSGNEALFDNIVVYENFPVDLWMKNRNGSLGFEEIHADERTNYPITLVAGMSDKLVLEIAFDTGKVDSETVNIYLNNLHTILKSVAARPEQRISQLSILSQGELNQLTTQLDRKNEGINSNTTVHALFEQKVVSKPDDIAVLFEDSEITYSQLNSMANQLAHYLIDNGSGPEKVVAIYMERSIEMIVSVLGVMKSGGAFVPIDPEYPADRVQYIINDSNAELILTQKSVSKALKTDAPVANWEDFEQQLENNPKINPGIAVDPLNLAYLIYTSGSTGKPKGTLLQHKGAVNMAFTFTNTFKVNRTSRVLQVASIGFDAFVGEVFPVFAGGATLVLVSKKTLLSDMLLSNAIAKHGVTNAIFTPALLGVLNSTSFPTLKSIVSAGEACPVETAKEWSKSKHFINGYGPTESTVGASYYTVVNSTLTGTSVPIGQPFENYKLYILDESGNPVPKGAVGELYIGGVGLARGYIYKPELTAEKFLPNPFDTELGARMYKTGDLVCMLPDGNLEYHGRIDSQVKLRGFRIELGEIENQIQRFPGINESIVLLNSDSDKSYLVAYIVAENGSVIEHTDLKSFLGEDLPDVMVPQAFIQLEKFPLNHSGKVDRKALPLPNSDNLVADNQLVSPKNQVEEILVMLWKRLLKIEQVSTSDNFFELGGHSLLVTQLASRLRAAFDIEMPLQTIFESKDLSNLADEISEMRQNVKSEKIEFVKVDRSGSLPLSFSQQRLWFLDKLKPGNTNYSIPGAIRITGKMDSNILNKAISEIVRRHESLRSVFGDEHGKPELKILPTMEIIAGQIDFTDIEKDGKNNAIQKYLLDEIRKPFDLSTGPLMRVVQIGLDENESIIFFNMHHIISDGWSLTVIIKEFAEVYSALLENRDPELDKLPIQYVDFAAWQQKWFTENRLEQQLLFWKNAIGKNPPVLELPADHPRPVVQSFNGDSVTDYVPKETGELVELWGQKEGVTPFMSMLAAFQLLLHKYTGQKQILVGAPIANRQHSETEKLIGFFVNTLVLKADFSNNCDFRSLVRQVREFMLNAFANQDIPFEQLVEVLDVERDTSHSPVFQVAFTFQNYAKQKLVLPNMEIEPIDLPSSSAKYDLTLEVVETDKGYFTGFEYNTDLFDRNTIVNLKNHYFRILNAAFSQPKQKIGAISFMGQTELSRMLTEWNRTKNEYPENATVHSIFEKWVNTQPDAPAAQFKNEILSYADLNDRAAAVAAFLQKSGKGPEDIIGICLERSIDIAVAVLGILKAGCSFLNIDPLYPRDRISYMIHDSGTPLILSHTEIAQAIPTNGSEIVDINFAAATVPDSIENSPIISPDNLAYVIYTSGSTGKPKGTLLSHRGLCNLAQAQRNAFNITPTHRVLQFSSLSFDASVWETVMALLNGACLVYAPQDELASGTELAKVIREQKINIVTLPPSVLSFVEKENLNDLKTVVTAGEACSLELVKKWGQDRQYINAYGPTETTVCASFFEASPDDTKSPPIGKPLENFQLYVLDQYWNTVPVGVAGELVVGGVGLARGYHQRPDLTAEKFIPNPFTNIPGQKLYRTGDLVRYLPDGNIEYLGRIDNQVKIRGYRIELGEIEAALSKNSDIQDVIVIDRDDLSGGKSLVAYFIQKNGTDVSPSLLRAILTEELPHYMVPAAFVKVDEFPLNPSGKIDKNALPKPDSNREQLSSSYEAPTNESEKVLTEIVGDLLGNEKIGRNDNFFELGGHSLLATQFLSRINEQFNLELPLLTVFESPTVAQLSVVILEQLAGNGHSTVDVEVLERGDGDLDDLFSEIDGMSNEDVNLV